MKFSAAVFALLFNFTNKVNTVECALDVQRGRASRNDRHPKIIATTLRDGTPSDAENQLRRRRPAGDSNTCGI